MARRKRKRTANNRSHRQPKRVRKYSKACKKNILPKTSKQQNQNDENHMKQKQLQEPKIVTEIKQNVADKAIIGTKYAFSRLNTNWISQLLEVINEEEYNKCCVQKKITKGTWLATLRECINMYNVSLSESVKSHDKKIENEKQNRQKNKKRYLEALTAKNDEKNGCYPILNVCNTLITLNYKIQMHVQAVNCGMLYLIGINRSGIIKQKHKLTSCGISC